MAFYLFFFVSEKVYIYILAFPLCEIKKKRKKKMERGFSNGLSCDQGNISRNVNECSGMKVFVRCKARTGEDQNKTAFFRFRDTELIVGEDERNQTVYKFDKVFNDEATNEEVSNVICEPLVNTALGGYNVSFMGYGQTGTGKTFTTHSSNGIILKTVEKLLEQMQACDDGVIMLSYLQIYQDKIYDLLFNNESGSLMLRDHPEEGIIVEGLTAERIVSVQGANNLLEYGRKKRITSEHEAGHLSNRSHCICLLSVTAPRKSLHVASETFSTRYQTLNNSDVDKIKSKIYLCDLAGSERIKNLNYSGKKLEEAKYINMSLLELGNVIHAVAARNMPYIPFRNTTLTRLLKESLRGEGKAYLMVCVSPYFKDLKETWCALNFGQRALLVPKRKNQNVKPRTDSRWLKNGTCKSHKLKIDYKALSESLSSKLKEIESAYFQEKENLKLLQKSLLEKQQIYLQEKQSQNVVDCIDGPLDNTSFETNFVSDTLQTTSSDDEDTKQIKRRSEKGPSQDGGEHDSITLFCDVEKKNTKEDTGLLASIESTEVDQSVKQDESKEMCSMATQTHKSSSIAETFTQTMIEHYEEGTTFADTKYETQTEVSKPPKDINLEDLESHFKKSTNIYDVEIDLKGDAKYVADGQETYLEEPLVSDSIRKKKMSFSYVECSFVGTDSESQTKEAKILLSPEDLDEQKEELTIFSSATTNTQCNTGVSMRFDVLPRRERSSNCSVYSDEEQLFEADTKALRRSLWRNRQRYEELLYLFEEITLEKKNDSDEICKENNCHQLVLKFKNELEVELNRARQQLDVVDDVVDVVAQKGLTNELSTTENQIEIFSMSNLDGTKRSLDFKKTLESDFSQIPSKSESNEEENNNTTSLPEVFQYQKIDEACNKVMLSEAIASTSEQIIISGDCSTSDTIPDDLLTNQLSSNNKGVQDGRAKKIALAAIENCEMKKELLLTKLEKLRLEAVLSCVLMNKKTDMTKEFKQLSLQSMRMLTSSRSTLSSSASCAHLPTTSQVAFQNLSSPKKPYKYHERFQASSALAPLDSKTSKIRTSRPKIERDAVARSVQTDFITQWLINDLSHSKNTLNSSEYIVSSLSDITSPTLLRRLSPCGQDCNDTEIDGTVTDMDDLLVRYREKKEKFPLSCLQFLRRKSFRRKMKSLAHTDSDFEKEC